MDINITSPLTATVSLIQNQNNLLEVLKYVALYAATGIAALLGVYLQGRSTHKLEIAKARNIKIQKQWEIFSKLKGIQSALPQDYLDTYQTGVFVKAQEAAARLHINSEENQRLHLDEARTLLIRSHENKRLFSKDRRELYEAIGSIMLLFPNEPKLREKINPIYSQVSIFESKFNNDKLQTELNALIPGILGELKKWGETFDPSKVEENFQKLETWKIGKMKEINKLVLEIVCQQLLDLLNYLQVEISSTKD
ncbi:MAG: hypothetical protein WCW68_03770 [Methanothrix sp.]